MPYPTTPTPLLPTLNHRHHNPTMNNKTNNHNNNTMNPSFPSSSTIMQPVCPSTLAPSPALPIPATSFSTTTSSVSSSSSSSSSSCSTLPSPNALSPTPSPATVDARLEAFRDLAREQATREHARVKALKSASVGPLPQPAPALKKPSKVLTKRQLSSKKSAEICRIKTRIYTQMLEGAISDDEAALARLRGVLAAERERIAAMRARVDCMRGEGEGEMEMEMEMERERGREGEGAVEVEGVEDEKKKMEDELVEVEHKSGREECVYSMRENNRNRMMKNNNNNADNNLYDYNYSSNYKSNTGTACIPTTGNTTTTTSRSETGGTNVHKLEIDLHLLGSIAAAPVAHNQCLSDGFPKGASPTLVAKMDDHLFEPIADAGDDDPAQRNRAMGGLTMSYSGSPRTGTQAGVSADLNIDDFLVEYSAMAYAQAGVGTPRSSKAAAGDEEESRMLSDMFLCEAAGLSPMSQVTMV